LTELEALRVCVAEPAKSDIAAAETMDVAFAILRDGHGFTAERLASFRVQAKLLASDTDRAVIPGQD
jgi:hypothetical protein